MGGTNYEDKFDFVWRKVLKTVANYKSAGTDKDFMKKKLAAPRPSKTEVPLVQQSAKLIMSDIISAVSPDNLKGSYLHSVNNRLNAILPKMKNMKTNLVLKVLFLALKKIDPKMDKYAHNKMSAFLDKALEIAKVSTVVRPYMNKEIVHMWDAIEAFKDTQP